MPFNAIKDDEASVSVSKKITLLRLFKYLLAYKKEIILVIFIMGYCVTVSLLNPLIIEKAIDVYIANKDYKGLYHLFLIAIALNLSMIVLVKIRMFVMSKVCNKILVTIRQELYTHIQTLDFHFFDSRPTGKILARIIGDINSLKDVLSNSVTTLIPDFVTICAVVVIMFIKNAKLAAASLITLPIMMIGIWVIQIYSHKRWQIHKKKSSNMNAFIHEDMAGIRVIQSFTAEQETYETFDELVSEHNRTFIDAVRLNDAFGSVIDFSWGLGLVSMYYFGVKVIGVDTTSVGLLIAFGTYVSMFWNPIMNLSNFYNQLITNISGAERIFEILDTKPEISDNTNVMDIPSIQGEVTFEHVSFSYDDKVQVLNDVSFKIREGETIALVGPTGAGKTTIVNLISRFYDVQDGNVYVDG